MEKLAETPIQIVWRPGVAAVVPDTLSRLPLQNTIPPASLDTVLVEESFLYRLSKAQFDPSDSEMQRFVSLAHSDDPQFRVIHKFNVDLVARKVDA